MVHSLEVAADGASVMRYCTVTAPASLVSLVSIVVETRECWWEHATPSLRIFLVLALYLWEKERQYTIVPTRRQTVEYLRVETAKPRTV